MGFLVAESQSTDGLSGHTGCPATQGWMLAILKFVDFSNFPSKRRASRESVHYAHRHGTVITGDHH